MEEIIIDTIVLDYLTFNQKAISAKAFSVIKNADVVYVCVSSLWELSNHVKDGAITLDTDFDIFYQNALSKLGIILLDTQWKALRYYSAFDYQIISKPWEKTINGVTTTGIKQELHKDPFDRMIIAHAITMNIPVVSPDKFFPYYASLGLKTIW